MLLIGAILAPGRRTVASVLRITGHARDKHFTNYHRFLSRAPWSARDGAHILLGHLVRAFVPVTTRRVQSLAERCQAPMVPSTVLNVSASEVMRAVATTVRTAASPLADHMAR